VPAKAQLLVAATPGDSPAVQHAELAYALGDGNPVTWLSLRVERGPVAVIAALPAGATSSQALDGWFVALERTASPSLLVPADAPPCGRTNLVRAEWPRAQGAPGVELVLESADDVLDVLDGAGLTLENALPEASSYVVWSWPDLEAGQTTRTLRVAGVEPLSLLPGLEFPVSLSLITTGPQRFDSEVDKRTLAVTFVGGDTPRTDYVERLRDFVAGATTPLLETRSRGLLFDWSIYGDVVSVAPLSRAYPHEASKELTGLDVDACSEQLRARGSAGAPAPTDCGDAVDLELALSAVDPELATLQRLALSSRNGVSPRDLQGGGDPITPLLRARHFDASECDPITQPPIVREPPASSAGGSAPPSGAGQVVVEERVVVVEQEPVEVDCGGSPEPEPVGSYDYYGNDDTDESCSADTSSDYDSEESDCSGDSSSSGETSGEADCSSDSSSASSTSSEDGCSGDSSSSSSTSTSDDGCSGDTTTTSETGGYDGDTCSGQAAPRAEPPARHAQAAGQGGTRVQRPKRLKTSLWSVAFAAVVLPFRRRKRGARAGG
jgi:hypothetical protein